MKPGDLVTLKCLPGDCPMYLQHIWEGRALVWTLGSKGRFWLSYPIDAFKPCTPGLHV